MLSVEAVTIDHRKSSSNNRLGVKHNIYSVLLSFNDTAR